MKQLKQYTFAGIMFVMVFGTLSHFFYAWSKDNTIVGLFSPVNESVWEHMKLIFFPMLIYSIYIIKKLKTHYPCIQSGFSIGILLGTILIPILFYTYTGILGSHTFIFDILTFILAVILAFTVAYKTTVSCKYHDFEKFLSLLIYLFIIAFFIFSIYPPILNIFLDPSNK